MKLPTYIHLSRHNIYIFRRRIPSNLQQYFNTNELRQTLATTSIKDASARAKILARDSDILFYCLEHNMPIDEKLAFKQLLENKKKEMRLREMIDAEVAEKESLVRKLKEQQLRHESDIEKIMTFAPSALVPCRRSGKANQLLSELVEDFLSDSEIKRRRDKPATVRKDRDALTLFLDIVGNKKISDVSQPDAALYSKEILTYKARGKERAVNTVNNHMSSVTKFSRWVVGHHAETGHVILDFTSLRYKKKKAADEERPMFELSEIKLIFTHNKFEVSRLKDKSKYWLLNIALYSGMRLEEITQLNPQTDIYRDSEGIWVFKILEIYDEKSHEFKTSTKKDASNRIVPIHSKLIQLGLIEYVEQIKSTATRMFPDTKIRDDRTGKNLGKKANYFIKEIVGIDKSLHSFRHTFTTLLKRAAVDESIAAALLGHKHGGISYSRYGKKYLTSTLQEALERHIKFEI